MKPLTIITLIGVLTLGACADEASTKVEEVATDATPTAQAVFNPENVDANAKVDVEVEGMMCVMGCGSEIRKHLYATQAVKSVSFDFIDGRSKNYATVLFNEEAISKEEIIQTIEDIESSDFKATQKKSSSTAVEEDNNSNSSDEESVLNVETKSITFPSITEILHQLFF